MYISSLLIYIFFLDDANFANHHPHSSQARKEHAEAIMSEFVPDFLLLLHWGGKILRELFVVGYIDWLPVLASSDGLDKLLGVPKLASATDHIESIAIYNLEEQWKFTDKVQALSFDITSTHTGRFPRVCVLLESKISRELPWLTCRIM